MMKLGNPDERPDVLAVLPDGLNELVDGRPQILNVSVSQFQVHGEGLESFIDIHVCRP
jgi:hypothetical protein